MTFFHSSEAKILTHWDSRGSTSASTVIFFAHLNFQKCKELLPSNLPLPPSDEPESDIARYRLQKGLMINESAKHYNNQRARNQWAARSTVKRLPLTLKRNPIPRMHFWVSCLLLRSGQSRKEERTK